MISALIPFRSADPQRIALWDFLRPQWEALPGVQLCTTADTDDPPARFSYARGANRCRALATGDVLLVHGADQLPPNRATWARIRSEMAMRPWMAVYAATLEIGQWPTRLILQGFDPDRLEAGRTLDHCVPILALRPDVWDDLGGMDERHVGWGGEDLVFRLALRALYPDGNDVGQGTMRALWHEPAPRDLAAANHDFYLEYMAAFEAGRMREYLREVRGG